MHRPHHISDRNILSIPDNIANHQKENTAACWYSESNMVTAPWGWRAVTTVLKQGSKSNAVKTSCFRHFSLGMYWLKRLKVMEGLPRKLISGNPRSTLWLFLVKAACGSRFNAWSWNKVPPGFSTRILWRTFVSKARRLFIYVYTLGVLDLSNKGL